jgi:DNA-binding XRE family transcriptional regulator
MELMARFARHTKRSGGQKGRGLGGRNFCQPSLFAAAEFRISQSKMRRQEICLIIFILFGSIKIKVDILCYQNFEDMISNKNNIGDNIKKLRAKIGLTQDVLTRKSGVKYTTLSKIESRVVTKPTVHIMAKIAKALNSSIEELLK